MRARRRMRYANEAHGTGTALGDPIETGSLVAAVVAARRQGALALAFSSVKGNLAHGESTAGVTGLLKLSCGLEDVRAAANPHLRLLNPKVGGALRSMQLALPTQEVALAADAKSGGVSSFGYAGTIAHAVLRHARGRRACRSTKRSRTGGAPSVARAAAPLCAAALPASDGSLVLRPRRWRARPRCAWAHGSPARQSTWRLRQLSVAGRRWGHRAHRYVALQRAGVVSGDRRPSSI